MLIKKSLTAVCYSPLYRKIIYKTDQKSLTALCYSPLYRKIIYKTVVCPLIDKSFMCETKTRIYECLLLGGQAPFT